MSVSKDISGLVDQLSTIPRDNEGPVFAEPWQAEVFAMTLMLHEKGLFTWSEWATQLHQSIRQAQLCGDPDLGNTYYDHWLDALEAMILNKRLGNSEDLAKLYAQWKSAASTTPHGQPITLDK